MLAYCDQKSVCCQLPYRERETEYQNNYQPSYLLKISLANNNENRKESLLMPTESLQHAAGPNLEMPLETLFD